MKKFIALALAALCVSAAQAVTQSWTSSSLSAGRNDITASYGAGSECSFVAAITIAGDTTGRIFAAGQYSRFGNSWINTMSVSRGEDGKLTLTANNDSTKTLDLGAAAAGDYKIAFTLKRGANNATSVMTAFINGEAKGSLEIVANTWSGPMNSIWVAEGATISSVTAYTGILTEAEGKAMTEVVPEPTALALLALGVAGLALKRKNA